jgi:hypothetical protein
MVGSTHEPCGNLVVPITTSSNRLLLDCKLINESKLIINQHKSNNEINS